MTTKQTEESFWSKVDIRDLDECWNWLKAKNNSGYGTVGWHGVTLCAHRVAAWLLGFVNAPEAPTNRKGSGFILHSCDNPACCNPTHFDIGTYEENLLACYARKRRAQPQGFAHENAKLTPDQASYIKAKAGIVKQTEMASKFGVSQACISLIQRNISYRNCHASNT